jgi:hypothetical protein
VLVGSFLSPLVRRAMPVRAVLVLEALDVARLRGIPDQAERLCLDGEHAADRAHDSVDRLGRARVSDRDDAGSAVGRSESVRSAIALSIAPLGPLAAGALLDAVSARATIGVFAALAFVLAAWGL